MWDDLQNLLEARYEWRMKFRRRRSKVSERCALGFRNLAEALHKEIIRHNTLGKRPKLGMRKSADRLDIHRLGHLSPILSFILDDDNVQIVSCAPLYEGSSVLSDRGKILAAFLGSVLIVDPEGRMIRFGYAEAAEVLLRPVAAR